MSHLTIHTMGALLGSALEARGMSQAEFCRLAGVSTKHLNQVITGKAVTTLAQFDYWAYLLGCEWHVQLVVRPPAPGRDDAAGDLP